MLLVSNAGGWQVPVTQILSALLLPPAFQNQEINTFVELIE